MYTKSKIYSDNFIEKVAFRVKSGEITIKEAQKIYGIGGNMTIQRWLDLVDIDPKKTQDIKCLSRRNQSHQSRKNSL